MMEYKIKGKWFYCSKPTGYLVGVSKAGWKKRIDISGETCLEHVIDALNKIGTLSFGTIYWPAVANHDGELLYHSFQADKRKLSYVSGWNEYLNQSQRT